MERIINSDKFKIPNRQAIRQPLGIEGCQSVKNSSSRIIALELCVYYLL